ncbi:MAG: transport system permease protein [Desulfomicrobiaceae bacterium]|jgi:iron complex transport system permease protein|nr:transport system permease protein [Desulfomicrobiaceae bacterium]
MPSTPRPAALFAVPATLVLSAVAALKAGSYPIGWSEVLTALTSPGNDAASLVVDLRLARLVLALACGAALGMAGAVLQTILGNPLADPFTLGVSSGAGLGATLALVSGASGGLGVSLAALMGAAGAVAVVLGLCWAARSFSRESLVLAGIIVSTFLAACIALMKSLHEDSVASIVFWLLGSLQNRSWPHVAMMLPLSLPGMTVILASAKILDVLALGGEYAHTLGVRVAVCRTLLVLAAAALTASSVAVCGIIGFVGLVVPHGMRLLLGPRHGLLLPACAVMGGVVLLWADVAARTVLAHGAELPVGVITALAGAPAFCFVLLGSRRQA